ncbi:GntR family transcriptional regulator [Gordonia sp. PDNC005]|uniref:GntR family transcriptional regulator n=1 Tax=unclassified Gordonia (in: high G+C Gram-positive bacteria) TaxID=2657482 RepID=UPI001964E678|nr:GntR family transcriptional regulator [Gordonia sp. PDNC005]QRY64307.1 GntR family transcriptional regulator [Gordonia sp. PDNC005]
MPITTDPRRRRADDARVVADVLRREIDRGDRTGALDENALAAEFDVSRNAVRDALGLLSAQGQIDRAPRVGTHVVRRKVEHGIDELRGLKETLLGHGDVRNEIRVATVLRAPVAVAHRLHLTPGDDVVYIERLRYLDDEPVSLDLTYLTPDVGIPLLDHDIENTDVFVLLEVVSGERLHSAEQSVEAANADPHSAANLDVPPGTAVLLMERLTRLGQNARPVDLEYLRIRSDRISLHATAFRDTPTTIPLIGDSR